MSSDVSNAKGRKKAAGREKNGEESSWEFSREASPLVKIPRGLLPRGACGSAAKATAKEIPPATQARKKCTRFHPLA